MNVNTLFVCVTWRCGLQSSHKKSKAKKTKKGTLAWGHWLLVLALDFFFFFVGWQQPVQPPCVLVLHDRWWEAMPRTHNVYCGHDDTLRSIWISIVCSLQLHECVSSSCLSKIYIRKKKWGKSQSRINQMSPFDSPPIAKNTNGQQKREVDTTPDCSRVVPHPSTKPAQCSLTSEFGWDLVHSAWYGRIRKHKHQTCA